VYIYCKCTVDCVCLFGIFFKNGARYLAGLFMISLIDVIDDEG
jgi:hypothetical protein